MDMSAHTVVHADPTPGHTDRLRIVIASTQPTWGGGECQAGLLASGLRSRGHECFILARTDSAFATRMRQDGFRVVDLPGRARSVSSLRRIRRTLRSFAPHVLHMNDSASVTAVGFATCGLPIPMRVAARRVAFPLRSALKYRWLTDRVVCVSEAAQKMCLAGGLKPDRLDVVYDGVDATRIASGNAARGRQSVAASDQQPFVLSVGSLLPPKGHQFLLEAMPAILKQFPATKLVIAGEGELRAPLQQQIQAHGLQKNVSLLGYRSDVPDLVAAADLFIMPSLEEGLGSSIIDSMLAQTPIVATTAGGIPELVGNGHQRESVAWLVPPANSAALARAIMTALAAPEQRQAYASKALLRATQHFTSDRMVEQTIEIYRRQLRSGASPGADAPDFEIDSYAA